MVVEYTVIESSLAAGVRQSDRSADAVADVDDTACRWYRRTSADLLMVTDIVSLVYPTSTNFWGTFWLVVSVINSCHYSYRCIRGCVPTSRDRFAVGQSPRRDRLRET